MVKFLLIIVLALTIRLYHHHHILVSDEANNMLTIKALIEGDGFRDYFFIHPPIFPLFSAAITYPFGDDHHIVQYFSIVFSLLSYIPFYLIVSRVFDKKTALLSLFVLAVMPINIFYSTWIKQDAMLLFVLMWTLYFYISDRLVISGLLFGIALLTKEPSCFLLPVAGGWEVIKGWEGKRSVKRLVVWVSIGLAVSGWWYIFFGRRSFGLISNAISGGNFYESAWHYPWYYYFRNLRADLTLTLSLFFITGLALTRKGISSLPVLWFLSFYIPLSIMKVKAPWYAYLASPPLAVLTSAGFLGLLEVMKNWWQKTALTAMVLVLISYNLYSFNVSGYYQWLVARKLPVFYPEEYLGEGRVALKGEKKVVFLEYNPTLQYYLGISDRRIKYAGYQFAAMDMARINEFSQKYDIGHFVIDRNSINYLDKNISDMRVLFGEPKVLGSIYIFTVR